ncbi:MAG TPA: helix-turn-helix transcriptional regulator, partial [Azonexus sp.]|nr:helix-turn-helix transcriptional regulator [Azonexus sp.]
MNEQVSGQDPVSDEDTAVAFETPVGEQLRQAREARGLEVADISQTLKLGPRQVEALESGDWNGLPGHTFIRGFVRNYARLLQLDPAPMMAQLDRILEKPIDNLGRQGGGPAPMPSSSSAGISRRDRQVMSMGVGLVVLAALAYFLIPSDLSALRDSVQSLLDSIGRKEVQEQAAAPVAD